MEELQADNSQMHRYNQLVCLVIGSFGSSFSTFFVGVGHLGKVSEDAWSLVGLKKLTEIMQQQILWRSLAQVLAQSANKYLYKFNFLFHLIDKCVLMVFLIVIGSYTLQTWFCELSILILTDYEL